MLGKMITEITKENVKDEEICENSSIIFGNIARSLKTFGEMLTFYKEICAFSIILSLLGRHIKNNFICENLTEILKLSFLNFNRVSIKIQDETKKAIKKFLKANGIGYVNEIMNEHTGEKATIANCIAILKELSSLEGKCHKYFLSTQIILYSQISKRYSQKRLTTICLRK